MEPDAPCSCQTTAKLHVPSRIPSFKRQIADLGLVHILGETRGERVNVPWAARLGVRLLGPHLLLPRGSASFSPGGLLTWLALPVRPPPALGAAGTTG